jgi:hypothetical protein
MLNYLEHLLENYDGVTDHMKSARVFFIQDTDSSKFIINLILDTELKPFVLRLVDYKLEKSIDINTELDILKLDSIIKVFKDIVTHPELQRIMVGHYNPIWRVAAFFIGFLLVADGFKDANR